MTIAIADVVVSERMRTDLGDIDALANSIREHGLIQPIVVNREKKLIAGGRRLAALKRLGLQELLHADHYVWKDEVDPLKLKGMELEENLRRKELSWQEIVLGKQQLLAIMQQIHGTPSGGRPKIGEGGGFGVNKLATMLGENAATTSQDLQVAAAIQSFPTLARAETKANAMTQLKILGAVASMSVAAKSVPKQKYSWTLYECDFRMAQEIPGFVRPDKVRLIDDESVDLIWTDLPYGADVDKMSAHAATSQVASFNDNKLEALSLLESIANESFRVLKQDRFAVFCFGFVLYTDLVFELGRAGFSVNPVPFVWAKNTKSGENPTTRYSNCYEPLIVAAKGNPVFIRPGRGNVLQIPVEQGKLQAVQKPVALIKEFLLDTCGPGATVLDWCAGTGSTGVAAHALNMRSILFEKDPSMALLAKTRLEALK